MIKSVLGELYVSINKPLNKFHSRPIFGVLELFPKKDLRILARACGIPRSGIGRKDKLGLITNIYEQAYKINLKIELNPRS